MNLLDLLFPKRCVGCKKVGFYICPTCASTIRYIDNQICPVCMKPAIGGATHPQCNMPWGLDGLFAAAQYDGVMRTAIRRIKYRYTYDMIHTLTQVLIHRLPHTLPAFDTVISVPLYAKRQRDRGFNQSALLAKDVGKHLAIFGSEEMLIRVRNTKPQFGLKKHERRVNVYGAFLLRKHAAVKGKHIALIDDVATTMATLSECAKVLKRNGAQSVWGIVVAHG